MILKNVKNSDISKKLISFSIIKETVKLIKLYKLVFNMLSNASIIFNIISLI